MSNPSDLGHAASINAPHAAGTLGRWWSHALGRALRLPLAQTRVATRGFQVDSSVVAQRLEAIGATFALGYNCATRCSRMDELITELQAVAPAERGFAFEGAAMGLALTDWMTPGRRWFAAFVAGPARPHEYMAWVGLGWALARLPLSPVRALSCHQSIHKWLALDGWGFHAGYFHWPRTITLQRRPRSLQGATAQVFDQGLGRSLWFVFGARPIKVVEAIAAFAPARRGDLWSGVGLASAYAGGADHLGLGRLLDLAMAAGHGGALGQGLVFAAQARERAGNPAAHTALACQQLLGLCAAEAAALALHHLPLGADDINAYQRWRAAIGLHCEQLLAAEPAPAGRRGVFM